MPADEQEKTVTGWAEEEPIRDAVLSRCSEDLYGNNEWDFALCESDCKEDDLMNDQGPYLIAKKDIIILILNKSRDMKTVAEVRDLLNQVYREEISFSRMVELLNERTSEEGKPYVENSPVRKPKKGDKVRIKHGVSSKTHESIRPFSPNYMDKLIGKELTVKYCSNDGIVACDGYLFSEDWLEPYVEELKEGDLAIFWNGHPKDALIRLFDRYISPSDLFSCVDKSGSGWKNAIKFESKEQYERLIKGEI